MTNLKAAGLAAVVVAACGVVPASAWPVVPEKHMPTLEFFFKAMVETHELAQVCAPTGVDPDKDWQHAADRAIAILWASKFPEDFVRRSETILASPGPGIEDCGDKFRVDAAVLEAKVGWGGLLMQGLNNMELNFVEGPKPGELARMLEILDEEAQLHRRHLECIAATQPLVFPVESAMWTNVLAALETSLLDNGYDPGLVQPAFAAAQVNALWSAPAEAELRGLRAECLADPVWQERYATYQHMRLEMRMEAVTSDGENL